MMWIDSKRFLREEGDRYGCWEAIKDWLLTMFYICTVIGLPIWCYAVFFMFPRTRRYIKKKVYDIEDTQYEEKIIKTQYNQYGIVWWKNWERCRLLLKAEYDDVQRCDSGVFIVKQNGKYGIFRDGKLKVPIKYDYLKYMGNDKFMVSSGQKQYINSYGERLYEHG